MWLHGHVLDSESLLTVRCQVRIWQLLGVVTTPGIYLPLSTPFSSQARFFLVIPKANRVRLVASPHLCTPLPTFQPLMLGGNFFSSNVCSNNLQDNYLTLIFFFFPQRECVSLEGGRDLFICTLLQKLMDHKINIDLSNTFKYVAITPHTCM